MAGRDMRWQQYQEQQARQWAAAMVQDAVIQYPSDRKPFYRLHHAAGIAFVSIKQTALHDELARIANGLLHLTG